MTSLSSFHSSIGTPNFLGLRTTSLGAMEIVYDDGGGHHIVFRVQSPAPNEARIGEALKLAVDQVRVVPALFSELKKRSISIEAVAH
ncbi:MAG: hypothetical protein KGH84_04265 [Paracoccaceae bacterium]|nr:hypothetical protein [Paracoccaceae bacterium]